MTQQETAKQSDTDLDKEEKNDEVAFTYVNRVNKQKRKNRKGRQNGTINPPSSEDILQKRIEYIRKRKQEIQDDSDFCNWLNKTLPLQKKEAESTATPSKSALALGLGSVKDARPAQVQLAFFLLLCEHLGIQHLQAFDPICGDEDFSLLTSFNVTSLKENKQGLHTLDEPTFVFMPHCTSTLYENFLKANWTSEGLARVFLCCNNLERYVSDKIDQKEKQQRHEEQSDSKSSIRSTQSCIDRSIDYLTISEVPNLHSGQLSNALNDLALHTFVPISSFIPQSQQTGKDDQLPPPNRLPNQNDNFWTVVENTKSATELDPELI